MIIDDRLEFCDAVAATGTDASAIVGDVVDTGNFTKDLGAGEPLYLVIQVTTAYSGGTSVEFQLRTSTLAALTGGTTTTLVSTSAIAVATAAAGYTLIYALPTGPTYQQYLGMWKVTVGAVSAGAINAFLTTDPSKWRAYTDNDPGSV